MELAEHLDPDAWSQIMQRFFRILCDGIERFEGFVDKFTGDGGMALFGAPIAQQRACYARSICVPPPARTRARSAPSTACRSRSASGSTRARS
jgi:class 3 adenylate cyclase